jgi:hypothetical protein
MRGHARWRGPDKGYRRLAKPSSLNLEATLLVKANRVAEQLMVTGNGGGVATQRALRFGGSAERSDGPVSLLSEPMSLTHQDIRDMMPGSC